MRIRLIWFDDFTVMISCLNCLMFAMFDLVETPSYGDIRSRVILVIWEKEETLPPSENSGPKAVGPEPIWPEAGFGFK